MSDQTLFISRTYESLAKRVLFHNSQDRYIIWPFEMFDAVKILALVKEIWLDNVKCTAT